MQDPQKSQDIKLTSEQAVISSIEQLKLSPSQREIQRLRDELRDCALYSGVGVICDIFDGWDIFDAWDYIKDHLSVLDYKIIPNSNCSVHLQHTTLFPTIAQSIAYSKPPAAAESSDSPPFVIAVFVSGWIGGSACTVDAGHGSMDIVDDIIAPFLPRLAPHLKYIPKLFFITAMGDPHAPPPYFPDDPDGNYCVAYHVTNELRYMDKWADHITYHLFLPGMTVQDVTENCRAYLDENNEHLHYFTSLKNMPVLKKYIL